MEKNLISMILDRNWDKLRKNINLLSDTVNSELIISRKTALIIVCMDGFNNPEIVELLLEYGADPNIVSNYGDYPLYNALMINNENARIRTIKLLFKYGADPNIAKGETKIILHTLIENRDILPKDGYLETVKLILDNEKTDVNIQDCDGETPLMVACKCGNLEMVELLLKYGTNVNIKDNDGCNALNYISGREEKIKSRILKNLLNSGIDIDLIPTRRWIARTIRKYEMKRNYEKQIAEYEKIIEELRKENEELRHRPGNPGYQEAFKHFKSLVE